MYPHANLPENLVAFCGVLRRAHGFRIGPGEMADAARALSLVDVGDEQRVRDAWRPILASSRETARVFDAAFDAFFFPGPRGTAQSAHPAVDTRSAQETERRLPPPTGQAETRQAEPEDGDAPASDGQVTAIDERDVSDIDTGRWARAQYSPLGADGTEDVMLLAADTRWREAARTLVRRLELGVSRRWRPGRRGRRFDLRRTWRASLQTGGEAVTARWLHRVRRSPRLVVVIDGSRSMGGHTAAALTLAVALASATRRVDVFAFSTEVVSLTRAVRETAAGRPHRLSLPRGAWGGGTSIGESLHSFWRRHGDRLVGPTTLVLIVSDGLDVGEPQQLSRAMQRLHRRSAGVTWLNPLLDTPGFTPTSRGMRAARPYITTLSSVADAAGLARLARTLRLRH